MDILSLEGEGRCLTVVSPDIYSASVTSDGVARLTLLRSPLYAHEGGSTFASAQRLSGDRSGRPRIRDRLHGDRGVR